MKASAVGSLCSVFMLLGCHRDIQNTEAVRQGILDYLAKRPDLISMDVSVGSVAFRKNEADALVYFRAKDSPVNNGMEMKYTLERNGDRWVVKGRAGSGVAGNPHQGMANPGMGNPGPSNGMPLDSSQMGGGGQSGSAPALPPGHPPLTQQQTRPAR